MNFLKRLSTEQIIFIVIGIFTVVGLSFWIFKETNRPQPGTAVADLGRGHVPVGTEVFFNSNPPTSGPHYEVWTRAAVLDAPPDDRFLVHSLEHGYIIMSYNCDLQNPTIAQINEASMSARLATDSASLTEPFKSESCTTIKNNLTKVFDDKGKRKLIVVPRPELNAQIAVTAWNKIQKFDSFNETAIKEFIDAYINQGPEKTME